jgi:hypothetical protein
VRLLRPDEAGDQGGQDPQALGDRASGHNQRGQARGLRRIGTARVTSREISDSLRVILSHADGLVAGGLALLEDGDRRRLARLLRDVEDW